jgi:hypothetical protein
MPVSAAVLRRRLIDGQRGLSVVGEPVYSGYFQRPLHVVEDLACHPEAALYEGWDFGPGHPCVVWAQFLPVGALHVLWLCVVQCSNRRVTHELRIRAGRSILTKGALARLLVTRWAGAAGCRRHSWGVNPLDGPTTGAIISVPSEPRSGGARRGRWGNLMRPSVRLPQKQTPDGH